MAQGLLERGHQIQAVAPDGSELAAAISIQQVAGALQVPAQFQERHTPIAMPPNPVLGKMWELARQVQLDYDVIVNFAFDWLPFYLTPFFETPIAHWISMGSLNDALDQIAGQVAANFPQAIGVYTRTQAATFPFAEACYLLGSGLDLSLYDFCQQPGSALCWLGRIAPEKALEDAVAAVDQLGIPLKIMGQIQDQAYWQQIQAKFPTAPIEYLGFLGTAEMQSVLRQCRGLLVTSRWVEAFGNVLIEALACGVPVIAYARGGPVEIVRHGQTGWLVEPDSVPDLVKGIQKLDQIDRRTCRQQAEQEYSLAALGDRAEQWLHQVKGE
ncbi:MAG: glycosyltransferase [Aphanocapsa sp. GSE-SYN-MK-11-07L]|nr:glycosyltransferase [Aphanocapsa sp. GSE-SYN-MK-11-07L]